MSTVRSSLIVICHCHSGSAAWPKWHRVQRAYRMRNAHFQVAMITTCVPGPLKTTTSLSKYPSIPTYRTLVSVKHTLSDLESIPLHWSSLWSRMFSSRKCSFGCLVNGRSLKSRKRLILSLPRLWDSATYALKGVGRPLGGEPMSAAQYSIV